MLRKDSDSMSTIKLHYKIVIIGESGVGKSCLAIQYIDKEFNESVATLSAATFQKEIELEDRLIVQLNIWDTAGQERFNSITPMYYRQSAVCLVVFSVCSSSSFEKAKWWINQIRADNKQQNIALLANKCDLAQSLWQVQIDAVKLWAAQQSLWFYEVSAKTGQNVDYTFFNIIQNVYLKGQIEEKVAKVILIDSQQQVQSKKCC